MIGLASSLRWKIPTLLLHRKSTAGRSHNVGHFGYSPKLSVVNRSIPARQRQQQILSCCQSHAAAANGDTSNHRKQSKHDAIVVLGGGLTAEGGIPGWGQQRLKKALQIYKQPGGPCPILCLGGGTPHKPAVLSESGHVIHEGSAYAAYLLNKGVPAKHLLKEVSSYDTVGNAYFSLVIHALPAGWRRLAVITSDFHMPRSQSIFQHCSDIASLWKGQKDWFQVSFHVASDEGVFESTVLKARKQREEESLQTWLINAQKLKSVQQLHYFIHMEHTCYSVAHQAVFGQPQLDDVDDKALASY